LIAAAVYVTWYNGHTGLDEAEMLTPAFTIWSTLCVIWFETTGLMSGHEMEETSSHVMISPLTGIYAYTGPFDPTSIPFFFQ
jgi:hypothetical protein